MPRAACKILVWPVYAKGGFGNSGQAGLWIYRSPGGRSDRLGTRALEESPTTIAGHLRGNFLLVAARVTSGGGLVGSRRKLGEQLKDSGTFSYCESITQIHNKFLGLLCGVPVRVPTRSCLRRVPA
jgi:hypothetical protein